jgi:inositol hexakisphosphate/diphosphoinositol-pentakisphosphate kinase
MIGNNKLKKPFVEKPFDAEDHEVCIYYPEGDGGGRKMLFRKQTSSCSSYDGNYIYEEYLATNGFDIKVYTVGPYYMYA